MSKVEEGLASVGRGLFVLRVGQSKEVFQLPLQRLEGGSLHGVLVPALQHNLVESWRAARGALHAVAVFDLVQDLSVGHPWKKGWIALSLKVALLARFIS